MRLGEFIKKSNFDYFSFGEKIGESGYAVRSWAMDYTIPRPVNMKKIYRFTHHVVDEFMDRDGNVVKYIGGCDG